jgi:hypothetical protein
MRGTAPFKTRAIPQGQPTAVPGAADVQNWVFYDSQTYAQAGQAALTFFQQPLGQSGRTLQDTNFPGAGALPAGMTFTLQEIMVRLLPGAAVLPGSFGAQAAPNFLLDEWKFRRSGVLELDIANKTYAQDAPLDRFPMDVGIDGFGAAADATTAGANLQTLINYGVARGRIWRVADTQLAPQVNFSIKLSWPNGVQTISAAGVAMVYMKGVLSRFVQ